MQNLIEDSQSSATPARSEALRFFAKIHFGDSLAALNAFFRKMRFKIAYHDDLWVKSLAEIQAPSYEHDNPEPRWLSLLSISTNLQQNTIVAELSSALLQERQEILAEKPPYDFLEGSQEYLRYTRTIASRCGREMQILVAYITHLNALKNKMTVANSRVLIPWLHSVEQTFSSQYNELVEMKPSREYCLTRIEDSDWEAKFDQLKVFVEKDLSSQFENLIKEMPESLEDHELQISILRSELEGINAGFRSWGATALLRAFNECKRLLEAYLPAEGQVEDAIQQAKIEVARKALEMLAQNPERFTSNSVSWDAFEAYGLVWQGIL